MVNADFSLSLTALVSSDCPLLTELLLSPPNGAAFISVHFCICPHTGQLQ